MGTFPMQQVHRYILPYAISYFNIFCQNYDYFYAKVIRALYKDAPFIILDEPTAALDPIVKAKIYSKFNEIVDDKTAIYISQRLSSCRFCDKIAVFDKGEIVQIGTYEELLSDKYGKYHELWHGRHTRQFSNILSIRRTPDNEKQPGKRNTTTTGLKLSQKYGILLFVKQTGTPPITKNRFTIYSKGDDTHRKKHNCCRWTR